MKLAAPAEQKVDPNRRYLPCPVCKSLMNRVNFAHHSGIVIDLCGKDGVWFDRDELMHSILLKVATQLTFVDRHCSISDVQRLS